jgi:fructose-1,6-bisphosphatase
VGFTEEVVKTLLSHIISPQVSGNESVAYRRAIAYLTLKGFLAELASGTAEKAGRVLPRSIRARLEDIGKQNPYVELAKSVAVQVKQRLAVELDKETAEKVAKVFEEMFLQATSSTPADILPAEERVKFYELGREMGAVALAFDSLPGPSPSRI